jgi:hypothetical protein
MKRHAGQAARLTADLLHRLGRIMLLALTLALVSLCLLALRLAQGPVDIPYLASDLATIVSGQGITVHMDRAQLAWAGFHEGGDVPLYLALGGIDIRNQSGLTLVSIPAARLVFSPVALLGGGLPILVGGRGATFNGSAVPVSLLAALRLDFGFSLARADIAVTLGAGRLGAGGLSLPISAGSFRLVFSPAHAALSDGRLTLATVAGCTPHVTMAATASRGSAWTGQLHIAADGVTAAALPSYWPARAAPATRDWVTRNITAGTVSQAEFTITGSAPRTLNGIKVTAASGGFAGTGLTMAWLPGEPPITGLNGNFTLTDIDHALITATAGHIGNVLLGGGRMAISGLTEKRQTGDLTLPLSGRIEDAIAVLNAPPRALLKAAPPGVAQASGAFTGQVTAAFPFLTKLTIAQVDLHADLNLRDVSVPVPLGGLAFTNGVAALHASMQGMALSGTADLAGGPCRTSLHAVFVGPDVLHDADLACTAGPALLAQLGLNEGNAIFDALTGAVTFDAGLSTAADHAQVAHLDADFTQAALNAPHLGWAKAAGVPGHIDVTGTMAHDRLTGLSAFAAAAPDLAVAATVQGDVITIAQAKIGRTDVAGRVTMPAVAGGPWVATIAGPRLAVLISPPAKPGAKPDAKPAASARPAAPRAPAPAPSGPLWQLTLAVAQAQFAAAPAPALGALRLTAAGQGGRVESAHAQAGAITADLTQPAPAREALHITAPDAGFLFQALGASRRLAHGDLTLGASWAPGGPIDGTLDVENFSLLQAPAFAKVMQALTVYGVGEATAGPGLAFSTLDAPFTLDGDTITLHDARAYSASLGFTASGTVGLGGAGLRLDATIIPAYALNALPGKIPVVGQLFTAQKGGGLFAVNAQITGPLDDPNVRVNPLSALTPGIVRKVFGVGF